ncbi:MAG: hypothetical protein Q4P15_11070 [Propionibacteriaceae bacterium]|nr:hypothetical protein [Propionibacteriaceae bacterium]
MTDPDQPFRRPLPGQSPPGHDSDVNSVPRPNGGDPVILDSEFHQSIWRPWEKQVAPVPTPYSTEGEATPTGTAPLRRAPRKTTVALSVAAGLALVLALVIPSLLETSPQTMPPLVKDMTSTPTIAWSADAGEPCHDELDVDHSVMTAAGRVWSLDLRNGRISWSVNIPGDGLDVTCLSGAHLVAVTFTDNAGDEGQRTVLLDGSTGRTVTEFPGSETVQVIPLGDNIGLVDRSNTLRAFAPGAFDEPLWTRRLPGPTDNLSQITVLPCNATGVQLWYTAGTNVDMEDQMYLPVISLADGEGPPWAQTAWSNTRLFQCVSDVIVQHSVTGDTMEVSVLDADGQELWRFEDAYPIISGSRLYASSPSRWADDSTVATEIREVDPRSGESMNDGVFTGGSEYVAAAPGGRLAVFQSGELTLLDEHLQPLPAVQGVDIGGIYLGRDLIYTTGDLYGEGSRRTLLTALDPLTAHVVWKFPLDPGQHITQFGQHLVVADSAASTVHGLKAGSQSG